ncbi:MAG: hypothetical protein IJU07_04785 [Synergistaceae bacterium]|nr:hypothetical protein [Synergistaceae bacterium]
MPIPLLLGAIGLFGAGKLAGAYVDNDDARKINVEARELTDFAEELMEDAQKFTNHALQALGRKKAYVLSSSVKNFVDIFGQIHNVDFRSIAQYDETEKFQLDQSSFDGLRELSKVSMAITDASAGALAAFAAYGAASIVGVPVAGVAASLAGLAANSTLSFLGGGGLMAGATSVLGGIIGAPVLAVLGIFVSSSASRNLEDAKSNKAQALQFAKQIETGVSICNGIRRVAYMLERILMRSDPLLRAANESLRKIISSEGTDYGNFSVDSKKAVAAAASLAKAVKTILDTPILTEDGKLTPESIDTANSVRAALPA